MNVVVMDPTIENAAVANRSEPLPRLKITFEPLPESIWGARTTISLEVFPKENEIVSPTEVKTAAAIVSGDVAHALPLPLCAMRTLGTAVEVPCRERDRDVGL